jgi:pseudouridine synthase
LATGVVITTEAKYDRTTKTVTAKTLPCRVHPLEPTVCEITLTEGRNRQIRKMMEAVGYNVLELHRLSFGEIDLSNLDKEGDWKSLSGKEMDWIRSLLRNAQHSDDRVKEA